MKQAVILVIILPLPLPFTAHNYVTKVPKKRRFPGFITTVKKSDMNTKRFYPQLSSHYSNIFSNVHLKLGYLTAGQVTNFGHKDIQDG